jgi:hypothetical protein
MPEDDATMTATDESTLHIPEDTVSQFPELIKLIKASHSMDDEERQYWVDVLPIMSEDQIKNLQDILDNEKKQIDDANRSYAQGMKEAADKAVRAFDEATYREKKLARVEDEKLHEEEEAEHEEALLKELENL